MITFGRYTIECVNFGFFRLDGGAMFGSVPKNLWSKRIPADEENCIKLATRCMLIRDGKRCILTDTGMGDKWAEKQRQIFAIQNLNPAFDRESVTDVILTHLHFDHAGGISQFSNGNPDKLELSYPRAKVFLQEANWKNAQSPNVREKASYLPENVEPLKSADLVLVRGSSEIYPDLWVHQVDGHTEGQQWIEIKDGNRSIVYPTDLIPTSHHLPLPFVMGYDICAKTILTEKAAFLNEALAHESIIVFEHDPEIAAGKIKKDEKGHYTLATQISV
ncbi:MAG: MBL fold metallo-hydrolase [Deltaproteobacteria bacterium]|nr:MBL fold metallo-hydrolase [Deltaproteobacteria bacterium]